MSKSKADLPADPASVDIYADKIRAGWNRSVEGILEAGKWAHRANTSLTAPQKAELCSAIPMSPSTLSRLAMIGADERLQQANVKALLPANASAITELARLKDREFNIAIASVVHPHVSRGQIKALRERKKSDANAEQSKQYPKLLVARVFSDAAHFKEAQEAVGKLTSPCTVEVAPDPGQMISRKEAAFFREQAKAKILKWTGLANLTDVAAIKKAGWDLDEIRVPADASREDVEALLRNIGMDAEFEEIKNEYQQSHQTQ